MAKSGSDDVDVMEAAALAGRSAETIRRWVWSGRLRAHKRGKRLLIARRELEQLLSSSGLGRTVRLDEWLKELERSGLKRGARESSAADLVLEDRRSRS